jgi:hypothetical protein
MTKANQNQRSDSDAQSPTMNSQLSTTAQIKETVDFEEELATAKN